ncbi:MAG TPA: TIGR03086 family metal-binding protein [Acidimicrobiia bacterium]|nr:TIGR03086 family metal-binding protein [Acidimicrobiia bacterium]
MRSIGCDASVTEVLAAALDRVGLIVDELEDCALAAPSVCAGWSVTALISHMTAVTEKFTAFARGETDAPRQREVIDEDVRVRYAATAAASHAAWRGDSMPELCRLPFGEFDRWTAAAINAFDVIVHGWDLACSVDREYDVDDASGALASSVALLLTTPAARRDGHYGSTEPAADAHTPFERALALTGRDPRAGR